MFPEFFKSRRGLITSDKLHDKLSVEEVHHLAILSSRIFNMHGASVGDVDLYKLFRSYFLDPEKRRKINEIL